MRNCKEHRKIQFKIKPEFCYAFATIQPLKTIKDDREI